jgi:hypothetical protein
LGHGTPLGFVMQFFEKTGTRKGTKLVYFPTAKHFLGSFLGGWHQSA